MRLNEIQFALVCFLIVPMSGLCIDLYAPSLPAIANAFSVSEVLTKYSISFYLLSFGIFQLFAGPITDRFGRKAPMLVGLIGFVIVSYAMTLLTSFYLFLLFRIFQGVCISLAGVSARAIIPDVFKGSEYKKMMNYMTIIWALGPIVAPFIGGYLQHYLGWRSPFYFLSMYGVIMSLLTCFMYRETLKQKTTLSLKSSFMGYAEMACHNRFVLGTICLGLLYSFLVIFSVIGVFVIDNTLGYSSITFGKTALLMGFGWFLGNMLNRFFLHYSETFNRYKMYVAMIISILSCLFLGLLPLIFGQHLWLLCVFMFISMLAGGVVFPNFFALCIGYFAHKAGSANAFMGACFILLSSGFTFIFGAIGIVSISGLAEVVLVFSVICLMLIMRLFSLDRKEVNQKKRI
ncbi:MULTISPECIES: MFS transporter [Cysteiniphilum]|uniref:MFS transporter n=1 Tax=Cysteiniphilum TaxID=2056696 RepID=UPI00177B431C|nr:MULTISPECIES: MFS transporter [Cysteiniphilum]